MSRSWLKRAWYSCLQPVVQFSGILYFRLRARGVQNVPRRGGVLLVSNHLSNWDPPLVGCVCPRPMNYLARDTLFRIAPFRWLINSLDAIPLDREGLGLAGMKETMRRLKRGEIVLIFPEGTRSADGRFQKLKPGFLTLLRRTKATLVPVGIAGLYEAWPRRQKFPCPGTVNIDYGPALAADQIAALDDEQLLAEVERRMRACVDSAAELRKRRLR